MAQTALNDLDEAEDVSKSKFPEMAVSPPVFAPGIRIADYRGQRRLRVHLDFPKRLTAATTMD